MIVLLSVPVDCVVVLSPVVWALSDASQLYVAGVPLFVNVILAVAPLQIVAALALVITGGFRLQRISGICLFHVPSPLVPRYNVLPLIARALKFRYGSEPVTSDQLAPLFVVRYT